MSGSCRAGSEVRRRRTGGLETRSYIGCPVPAAQAPGCGVGARAGWKPAPTSDVRFLPRRLRGAASAHGRVGPYIGCPVPAAQAPASAHGRVGNPPLHRMSGSCRAGSGVRRRRTGGLETRPYIGCPVPAAQAPGCGVGARAGWKPAPTSDVRFLPRRLRGAASAHGRVGNPPLHRMSGSCRAGSEVRRRRTGGLETRPYIGCPVPAAQALRCGVGARAGWKPAPTSDVRFLPRRLRGAASA